MSSDETQGGRDRQTLLGHEQESHGVNGQWNGRTTTTHTDDGRRRQNGNDVVSLAGDDGRHSDIVPRNCLSQKTNSKNEDDSEQHDTASSEDGSRSQSDVGLWADNNEVQNDLVTENNYNIGEDRSVPFDNGKEQVRPMSLNDYGAAQNDNVSGDVDRRGRNGSNALERDRQRQTCLKLLEIKDRGNVGTVSGTDPDIVEVTTVSEIDNGSGVNQAVALDDENRSQDGVVAWDNNEIVQDNFSGDAGNDSLLMITERNASYIRPAVIHIRSLALENFTLSETVEVWAWPCSYAG